MEDEKRIAAATTYDDDNKKVEEENEHKKFDRDGDIDLNILLKVPPADVKHLSLDERRYWLTAHFIFKQNKHIFDGLYMSLEEKKEYAKKRKEEEAKRYTKRREEEEAKKRSLQSIDQEEESKIPKIDI